MALQQNLPEFTFITLYKQLKNPMDMILKYSLYEIMIHKLNA